jgi:hypothetical protein
MTVIFVPAAAAGSPRVLLLRAARGVGAALARDRAATIETKGIT